jgi:capsular polysaccharide biosynthesis protein
MNLLSIARKIWRYKLLTVPVVLLVFCGAVYVVAIKKPVYEASASYILINPPEPPTPEEVARDPSLARINADNPYTRFSDQSVIVEVLASSMANESAKRALLNAGADPRYKVEPASEFGFSSPIVKITTQGASPEVAVRSAKLVGNAVTSELQKMQQAEGVDSQYRIKANKVDTPDGAQLRASGQLRSLVGVLGLGAVLLFLVVSVGDAVTTLRMERGGRSAPSPMAAGEGPWSAEQGRSEGLTALDAEEWPEYDEGPLGNGEPVQLFPDHDRDALTGASSARRRQHRRMQHGSRR